MAYGIKTSLLILILPISQCSPEKPFTHEHTACVLGKQLAPFKQGLRPSAQGLTENRKIRRKCSLNKIILSPVHL